MRVRGTGVQEPSPRVAPDILVHGMLERMSGRDGELEVRRLGQSPVDFGIVVGLLALRPQVLMADALVAMPGGAEDLTREVGLRLGTPVVNIAISPPRYDGSNYHFSSDRDRLRLEGALRGVCIIEGVSTDGWPVEELGGLLRSTNPNLLNENVHSLSVVQFGELSPDLPTGRDAVRHDTLSTWSVPS